MTDGSWSGLGSSFGWVLIAGDTCFGGISTFAASMMGLTSTCTTGLVSLSATTGLGSSTCTTGLVSLGATTCLGSSTCTTGFFSLIWAIGSSAWTGFGYSAGTSWFGLNIVLSCIFPATLLFSSNMNNLSLIPVQKRGIKKVLVPTSSLFFASSSITLIFIVLAISAADLIGNVKVSFQLGVLPALWWVFVFCEGCP